MHIRVLITATTHFRMMDRFRVQKKTRHIFTLIILSLGPLEPIMRVWIAIKATTIKQLKDVSLLFQAKTARKKVIRNKETFYTTDGDKIKTFHSSKI